MAGRGDRAASIIFQPRLTKPRLSEMSYPYRAVIFDFDGVVAEQGFRRALVEATGTDETVMPDLRREGMIALLKSGYVTGAGSEAEFASLFAQRTGLTLDLARLRRVIVEQSKVRSWVLDMARRLQREGLITAVLTDHTDWLDDIERRAPFHHAFSRVFNSYTLGDCKAQASVFTTVVGLLGVPAEQAVFIDDNPDNVARARSRGLAGIAFEERDQVVAELSALLGRAVVTGEPVR